MPGYDANGYDAAGYDRQGYNHDGYDRTLCTRAGSDAYGTQCVHVTPPQDPQKVGCIPTRYQVAAAVPADSPCGYYMSDTGVFRCVHDIHLQVSIVQATMAQDLIATVMTTKDMTRADSISTAGTAMVSHHHHHTCTHHQE